MSYDEPRAARYDELHAARFAEADAAVAVLAELARGAGATPTGGAEPVRALELGVGTGRLALPLAARDIEVWGIDNAQPMLARLAAKPGASAVRVVAGDFADVGDLVDTTFSLVFVAFNTLFELPSQDEQVRCLQGVAQCLSRNGVFVVEALAPDLTRLEQTVSALSADARSVVLQVTRHDPVTQQVTGADVSLSDEEIRKRETARRAS
jgi:SAM-dependent methyltransferase